MRVTSAPGATRSCAGYASAICVADGQHGVERRHRLLEDHGDARAAQLAQVASPGADSRSIPL